MSDDPEDPRSTRRPSRGFVVALAGVLVLAVMVGLFLGGKDASKDGASHGSPRSSVRRAPLQPGSLLPTLPPHARSFLDRLPLERRVGQLFLVDFPGPRLPQPLTAVLRRHGWGGVVFTRGNYESPGQSTALIGAAARMGRGLRPIRPLLVADQDGGPATAFPFLPPHSQPRTARRLRAADGADQARAAGRELHRRGITMTLAPQADLDVPSGAVSEETFSPDPGVVTRFVSTQLDAYLHARVIPAIGHFPGEGAVSDDPDLRVGSVGLSLADLRRRDEAPFKAIAARAPAIVLSNALYAAFDGVTPAVLLPTLVGELRGRLGFRGVMVSDDLSATVQATGEDVGVAAVKALKAGADLLYVSGGPAEQARAYGAVLAAARSGRISASRLKAALTRNLALKITAGVLPRR